MPLTRIKATAIGNDSITTAKLDDTAGGLTLSGTQFVKVPVGTTIEARVVLLVDPVTFQYYFRCSRTV